MTAPICSSTTVERVDGAVSISVPHIVAQKNTTNVSENRSTSVDESSR